MRTGKLLTSLIAVWFALLLTTAAPGQGPTSPRVQTHQLESKLMGATLSYNVILPVDYQTAMASRYPVLYLLHGLTGHYTDWVTHTNVADYAAPYRLIIVMPEGNNGWYTDSATVASDKYESYILQELMPDVQRRYRTIETRFGRSVGGLSMGGYGALKFGLKFPDRFIFAASMSGALEAAGLMESDLKSPGTMRDSVLGTFGAAGSETRKANDIYQIVKSLAAARVNGLPYFYLDCGTEDSLISANQQMAALMREKKIPHEFRELPGEHNWAFWDRQVQEVLKIAAEKMHLQTVHPALNDGLPRKPRPRANH